MTRVIYEALDTLVVSIPEKVLFQELGDSEGGLVILDIENGGYYGLNEVGARVWGLFRQGLPMCEIISTLVSEYDVAESQLRQDIEQFLVALQSQGLIEIHEEKGQ